MDVEAQLLRNFSIHKHFHSILKTATTDAIEFTVTVHETLTALFGCEVSQDALFFGYKVSACRRACREKTLVKLAIKVFPALTGTFPLSKSF